MQILVVFCLLEDSDEIVLTCPLDHMITKRIRDAAVQHGGPEEGAAFILLDDLAESGLITPDEKEEIATGCHVRKWVNAWTYAHLYGCEAHTAFEEPHDT